MSLCTASQVNLPIVVISRARAIIVKHADTTKNTDPNSVESLTDMRLVMDEVAADLWRLCHSPRPLWDRADLDDEPIVEEESEPGRSGSPGGLGSVAA